MTLMHLPVAAAIGAVSLSGGLQTAQPARPSADGATLRVPSSEESLGTVYYALTDRDRQIFFESEAPVEDIRGQSNKVIGYAVVSDSSSDMLVAGQWHLPVESIRTGIKLRDEHLAGPDWFDAENHPNIIVRIRDMRALEQTKNTETFTGYTGTLVVDLTLHGVTKRRSIPGAEIIMMPESNATSGVARGDLMAVRAEFPVRLSDHEVGHSVIGEKVAEVVDVDVTLYHSTIPPAGQ